MAADRKTPRTWLQVTALATLGLVCAATSLSPYVERAAWRVISEREKHTDALSTTAWVSKSGKTGIGITLELNNRLDRSITASLSRWTQPSQ